MMFNRIEQIYTLFFLAIISLLLAKFFPLPFLYGLTLILFLCFALLTVYSTMEYIISKEPDDLWKIGFLGLFGLLVFLRILVLKINYGRLRIL
ncbi:MAG: hypothetical protein XD85_0537 [Parcubacteria bacterium 34_609]|nr:MAG: hypothetical protein XD85_0537 [Parcubacteria bacterium 34_609]